MHSNSSSGRGIAAPANNPSRNGLKGPQDSQGDQGFHRIANLFSNQLQSQQQQQQQQQQYQQQQYQHLSLGSVLPSSSASNRNSDGITQPISQNKPIDFLSLEGSYRMNGSLAQQNIQNNYNTQQINNTSKSFSNYNTLESIPYNSMNPAQGVAINTNVQEYCQGVTINLHSNNTQSLTNINNIQGYQFPQQLQQQSFNSLGMSPSLEAENDRTNFHRQRELSKISRQSSEEQNRKICSTINELEGEWNKLKRHHNLDNRSQSPLFSALNTTSPNKNISNNFQQRLSDQFNKDPQWNTLISDNHLLQDQSYDGGKSCGSLKSITSSSKRVKTHGDSSSSCTSLNRLGQQQSQPQTPSSTAWSLQQQQQQSTPTKKAKELMILQQQSIKKTQIINKSIPLSKINLEQMRTNSYSSRTNGEILSTYTLKNNSNNSPNHSSNKMNSINSNAVNKHSTSAGNISTSALMQSQKYQQQFQDNQGSFSQLHNTTHNQSSSLCSDSQFINQQVDANPMIAQIQTGILTNHINPYDSLNNNSNQYLIGGSLSRNNSKDESMTNNNMLPLMSPAKPSDSTFLKIQDKYSNVHKHKMRSLHNQEYPSIAQTQNNGQSPPLQQQQQLVMSQQMGNSTQNFQQMQLYSQQQQQQQQRFNSIASVPKSTANFFSTTASSSAATGKHKNSFSDLSVSPQLSTVVQQQSSQSTISNAPHQYPSILSQGSNSQNYNYNEKNPHNLNNSITNLQQPTLSQNQQSKQRISSTHGSQIQSSNDIQPYNNNLNPNSSNINPSSIPNNQDPPESASGDFFFFNSSGAGSQPNIAISNRNASYRNTYSQMIPNENIRSSQISLSNYISEAGGVHPNQQYTQGSMNNKHIQSNSANNSFLERPKQDSQILGRESDILQQQHQQQYRSQLNSLQQPQSIHSFKPHPSKNYVFHDNSTNIRQTDSFIFTQQQTQMSFTSSSAAGNHNPAFLTQSPQVNSSIIDNEERRCHKSIIQPVRASPIKKTISDYANTAAQQISSFSPKQPSLKGITPGNKDLILSKINSKMNVARISLNEGEITDTDEGGVLGLQESLGYADAQSNQPFKRGQPQGQQQIIRQQQGQQTREQKEFLQSFQSDQIDHIQRTILMQQQISQRTNNNTNNYINQNGQFETNPVVVQTVSPRSNNNMNLGFTENANIAIQNLNQLPTDTQQFAQGDYPQQSNGTSTSGIPGFSMNLQEKQKSFRKITKQSPMRQQQQHGGIGQQIPESSGFIGSFMSTTTSPGKDNIVFMTQAQKQFMNTTATMSYGQLQQTPNGSNNVNKKSCSNNNQPLRHFQKTTQENIHNNNNNNNNNNHGTPFSSNTDAKRGIHKVITNTIKKYVNANSNNNTNNNINNNNINGIQPYFPNQPAGVTKDSNVNNNYNESSESYNRFCSEAPTNSIYNNNNIQTNNPQEQEQQFQFQQQQQQYQLNSLDTQQQGQQQYYQQQSNGTNIVPVQYQSLHGQQQQQQLLKTPISQQKSTLSTKAISVLSQKQANSQNNENSYHLNSQILKKHI